MPCLRERLGGGPAAHVDASVFPLAVRHIDASLDALEVVVVTIDAGGGGPLRALQVFGRVPDAVAGGALLVLLGARERACLGLASRTAILGDIFVAATVSVVR
jgi:hypothetical protein